MDEKRRKSDVEIELLRQKIEQFDERVTKAIEDIAAVIQKHDREIYGDGNIEGVRSRVSVLEDAEKKRTLRERVMFGSVIGLLFKAFWDLFSAKHGG